MADIFLSITQYVLPYLDAYNLTRMLRTCRALHDLITIKSEAVWEHLSHVYVLSSLKIPSARNSRALVTRVVSLEALHGSPFTFTSDEVGYRDTSIVTRAVLIFSPLGEGKTHVRLLVRHKGAPVIQGRPLTAYNGVARYDVNRGHVVIRFVLSTPVPRRLPKVHETRWILSVVKRSWLHQKPEEFRYHSGGIRMICVPGDNLLSKALEAVAVSRPV
eukprot:PhF_6_TR25154/c7_g1_i2/m.34658